MGPEGAELLPMGKRVPGWEPARGGGAAPPGAWEAMGNRGWGAPGGGIIMPATTRIIASATALDGASHTQAWAPLGRAARALWL